MVEKNTNNIFLYLAFWTLYGPLAVGMWYYQGTSLLNLGSVLLIGLGIILGYIFFKEYYLDKKRHARTHIRLQEDEVELSREHIPDYDELRNFRILFADGGGAP